MRPTRSPPASSDRLPVWEMRRLQLRWPAGGCDSNCFFDSARGGYGGDRAARRPRGEQALKRCGPRWRCYASERGNLRHIRIGEEAYRPLPLHDYAKPPHPGKLFRERFQWVALRHPRIDFTPSGEIYSVLDRWTKTLPDPVPPCR